MTAWLSERKARSGSRKVRANEQRTDAKGFNSISYSLSGSDLGSEIASPPARVLGLDGEGGAAWEAWRAGIRRVTGKPVSALGPQDKPPLVDFANAHAGGLRGEDLMIWISNTAEVWARQHDPRFGGFKPSGCKTWLDAGRPSRAPPRNPAEITKQGYEPDAPWMKAGGG